MEIETLAVCRLCLKITSILKYGVPPEILMMLEALNIKKSNLRQKEDSQSVVCSICELKVKNIFNLKARCLKEEKSSVSSKLSKILDKTHSEIHVECRLCNNIISSDGGVILLDVLKENNIIEPFQKYILKIDLEAIEKSVICELCRTSLRDFCNFYTIEKREESKETSQLLNSKDHSRQENDFLNKTDTRPVHLSLYCTDFNESDTVKVKLESNDNDIYTECKITDAERKKGIIDENYCCALEIKEELGNTVSHDIESVKGKINEEIKNECYNASENLELQLKSKEIDIKSGPEEFMSELTGSTETSEQSIYRIPFQTTDANGIAMDKSLKYIYQTITTYSSKDHTLSLTKTDALKVQKCQQTKYKVSVKRPIDPHEISDHIEKHKCRKCSYQSKIKSNLTLHMLTHKNADQVEMHKCQECTFESKYKHSLKQHMLTHKNADEVGMHKCQKCTYQSKHKYCLTHHMLIHKNANEVEMYKCQKCTFQSKYKHCLKQHMLTHNNADEVAMHECQECTFQSKYKHSLKKHMLTHKIAHKLGMHKCQKYTSQCKYECDLKKHMLIYKNTDDEIEMHYCEKCTYQSNQKSNLKKHMLIHKNPDEIPMYKCEKCNLQYKHKYYLKRHMLIHKNADEIEMHKCQKCTFRTKYKYSLTNHMLIHKNADEVEMHKCQKCTYQSKYKAYLTQHMLIHRNADEVKMYKCYTCTFQSKTKQYFIKHLLTHKTLMK